MPQMDEIGRRFMDRFVTITGKITLGEIVPLPATAGRSTSFNSPRRLLYCAPSTTLEPGDILLGPDGRHMLAAWNGALYLHGVLAKTFKLYDLDQFVTVDRVNRVVDAVSNLEKDGGVTHVGPIWCAIEPDGEDNEFLKMSSPRFRVISGFPLVLNDRIAGKYLVHRVDVLLGIYISIVS